MTLTSYADRGSRHGLGLSGHPFRGWEPRALLETLTQRWGMRLLDYWPWNRGSLSTSEYAALLHEYETSVYVVNAPSEAGRLCDPVTAEAGLRALLAAIDEAVELGAASVQFYTGVPLQADFLTSTRLLQRQLEPALQRAEEAGVTLLIENNLDQRNEDRRGCNPSRLPELLLTVCDAIGSDRLKVCFDPCNFYAVGVEAFPYAYDLLRQHIVNVHIKDCTRYSPLLHAGAANSDHLLVDSLQGAFLPVPVGQGAVNWHGVLARLEEDQYEGRLTLDPFSGDGALCDWCDASLAFLDRVLDQTRPQHADRVGAAG